MMLMVVIAVATLAFVAAAPHDRFSGERPDRFIQQLGLNISNLFNLEVLKCDVQIMLDVLGADPTEQACEAECHKLLQEGAVMTYGCPLVCHAFQNLAHYFHETPKPGQQNQACGGAALIDAITG
ncbi:uncharacterized protein LOC127844256 [Dreissena polymorpha]|uniref:Uncharacterized protein n=1 Tax=Dreissena polymorpha TaxID=45954 RepID=A0A9D4E9G9_DREPO|nr:uncharacterized protein LOC127844256 [Dreissena polymorpha]KAH3775598.1 hypothetical protein DPMN_177004 [Dreissena polymorpha]